MILVTTTGVTVVVWKMIGFAFVLMPEQYRSPVAAYAKTFASQVVRTVLLPAVVSVLVPATSQEEPDQQRESNVLIKQHSAVAQQAKSPFAVDAEQRAIQWKWIADSIPDIARVDAPYIRDGKPQGSSAVCLPPEQATFNLFPDIRMTALELFATEQIYWHAAINAGPTNHLLSSQVQCVNALTPGIRDAEFVHAAYGNVLPIAEVLEVEPRRFLTFEYIGEHDYLQERVGMTRDRGSMTTSADAAIKYRSTSGTIELALIEWKYTED